MLPITLVLLLLDYYTVTFLTEPVTVLSCVMAVAPFADGASKLCGALCARIQINSFDTRVPTSST